MKKFLTTFGMIACMGAAVLRADPVTTQGFLNLPRNDDPPGTLLSSPSANDSLGMGRTTTINYLNGWLVVGAEGPGSAQGSDYSLRVYDVSDPANLIRRWPSDFELTFTRPPNANYDINHPEDFWYVGNSGWNAHGSAQSGSYLLPAPVLRVQSFGAPVELGGQHGVPNLGELPYGYNRSSQAGPWETTMLWYGTADQDFTIRRVSTATGSAQFQTLATFDHVGNFSGGDWHPMLFGDLLIYARSGGAARDGVVVYRMEYHFDDPNPQNHTVTPHFVASLSGGFEGYWPTLFSDGSGLYVIGSATDILMAANITDAADPSQIEPVISPAASLTIPNFTNASYPVFQDQFGFIHNRKINMTAFLAGGTANDPATIPLTLNEAATGIDTSQMSLPLGNLWLTGGSDLTGLNPARSQGLAVWVHQQAPDTTAPQITYHIPQTNRTAYPRHAPLSFLLHEHPRRGGLRNGIDFAVRPVIVNPMDESESLGAFVAGSLIHDMSGVLTFNATSPLAADTTYQVDFFSNNNGTPANLADDIGFQDAAGNLIEPYTFRFSTGGGINAAPPPVITSVSASTYQPAPGAEVTITVAATGSTALEYRFNFDGTWSDWAEENHAAHSYASSGRPRVLVQVRDENGSISNSFLNLLVITPPAGPAPTHSGPMAIGNDPDGRRLWVVNPDADSVSVIDPADGEKIAEHSTGVGSDPRSIARDANGRYWITLHDIDAIRVLNPDGSVHANIALPYGSAPFGIVASPDGTALFASLYGSASIHRYSAANPSSDPVIRNTFPTPRALAVSGNGSRLLVTRFISAEQEGQVAEFAAASPDLALTRTFTLSYAITTDGGDRAAGVPNYLSAIAISPDGTRAAVASKQDNTHRGTAFGVGNHTHETTVRAVVSTLDLLENREIRHSRRDFDNSDSPSGITYSPLGDLLFVSLQGNNRITALDTFTGLAPVTGIENAGTTFTSPALPVVELSTGLAPQGVLLDAASSRLISHDFMGRSVTIYDATALLQENRTHFTSVSTTSTVLTETLSTDVLLGKRVFYNAADARMSRESYISCATCHIDGGHDGRTWDFTGRGEGFRRTTDLRGRGGLGHGNVHWSGNFDEIQDFEHDIRNAFGGTGFIDDLDFANNHPSPATAKADLSEDLDALAAYITSLDASTVPRSPRRQANGALSASAQVGREIFASPAMNCASCHSGDSFTNSSVAPITLADVFPNVGTTSALSGNRLGQTLTGIDTPTLVGLHATRSYLHHGQAASLGEVFTTAGGTLLLAHQATLQPAGPVSIEADSPGQGGGGFLRGALGGAVVHVTGAAGNGVVFENIDGGPTGGEARVRIRYIRNGFGGNLTLRVNGVSQSVPLAMQSPPSGWMLGGWRWADATITLAAGNENVIEVLRSAAQYEDFVLNAILVSNTSDLAAANPHRRVLDLAPQDQADLMEYLLSLDATPGEAPPPPTPGAANVALTALATNGGNFDAPFLDIDVQFSESISGLTADDFQLGGTAGGSHRHLSTLTEGTHYRLRIAGFSNAGSLTVQLPADAVGNNASNIVVLTYAPPVIDDIAALSDEFENPATLTNWLRNNTVEGWNADKLQTWDIDTTAPGRMRLMPFASSWFRDFTGAYTYKEVTGDFVVTMDLDVLNRAGTGRPNSEFSLAGIMVRSSRGITQAAPVPAQPANTVLPWPPAGYTTDWQPGTENYIFLSYGHGASWLTTPDGNNPNRWHYEVKTTTNGVSELYPRTHGVPENEPNATLQIVRRGSTFLLLRRHGAGSWIIENRFERPDLPATLQVGITTYTDWATVSAGWSEGNVTLPFHQNRIVNGAGVGNPDLIADVDFFRLRRPDPALTQAMLQAALVTGQGAFEGIRQLSAQAALVPYLGDSAAAAIEAPGQTFAQWLGMHLPPAQLADPAITAPTAIAPGGMPNVFAFLLGATPTTPAVEYQPRLEAVELGGTQVLRYLVPRNTQARGWHLSIQGGGDLTELPPIASSVNGAPANGPGAHGEIPGSPPVMVIGPPDPSPEPSRFFYRLHAVPDP
jgi:YVTN family beta-propeller protein